MDTSSHVPPGFRFHPTDEELVDYYLRKKVASRRIDLDVIKDVDLYRIEPWDLQELCQIGNEEQNEWYFFSHKDKKYPTGTRTNRATKAGFWKATGRDKSIYSKHALIGMRKTLVFYKGRAPNGQKSDWIMHEYRLETNENGTSQEEGWVVCRVFKKRMTGLRKHGGELGSPCWYDEHVAFMPDFDSPAQILQPYNAPHHHGHPHYSCKQELELQYSMQADNTNFLQLPQLESPKLAESITQEEHLRQSNRQATGFPVYHNNEQAVDQLTDWRALDKFVASQLSQEDGSKENNYSNMGSFQAAEEMSMLLNNSKREDMASDYASMSTLTCPIELWK